MTAVAATGQYVPHGVNESNLAVVTLKLGTALAAADTLDITLPSGMDKDFVPISFRVYSAATPAVNLNVAEANLSITNHNRSTGVTRLTAASAGIAINADIVLQYVYAAT